MLVVTFTIRGMSHLCSNNYGRVIQRLINCLIKRIVLLAVGLNVSCPFYCTVRSWPVRLQNLRKLSLLKCRETKELSSLRIFRAREVEPCLLYHRRRSSISMIQTRLKSGRNLKKHGEIIRFSRRLRLAVLTVTEYSRC